MNRLAWRTEFAWAIAAALVTTITAAVPVLHNPLFYFQDDFQLQFMPMFGEIARLLKSGEFPLFTDRLWHGGAIIGEYQFAIFNPASLAAYLAIDEFDQLHHAATAFVLFHFFVLAGGLFFLARELDAVPLASLLAALVGGTSSWLIYWGATTWTPALVGSAWLPWSLWGLFRAYRSIHWMIPAALLSYLVFVSGWPYANVALIAAAAVALVVWFHHERRLASCWRVALALVTALMLAAPALFPAAAYLDESARIPQATRFMWRPALDGLVVALGVPFYADIWRTWGGEYRLIASPPMYYLAWFVPVILLHALARQFALRSAPEKIILWVVCIVFAIFAIMPEVWFFRWPFRFLPYFHFALALLVARLVSEAQRSGKETNWVVWIALLAIILPFLVAISNAPELMATQTITALSIAGAALVVIWLQRRNIEDWPMFLVASHIIGFVILTAIAPMNYQLPDFRSPLERADRERVAQIDQRTFTLFRRLATAAARFGGWSKLPADYWILLSPGNTALHQRAETVNGYAPTLQRGFIDTFCVDQKGATCDERPSAILDIEAETELKNLDLMAVDRVVALTGSNSTAFAARAGDEWILTQRSDVADTFERATPQQRIGNIVQWPEGAIIGNPTRSGRSESYDVIGRHSGGRIVVARAWYPGFRAQLNGKPVRVEPVAGIVPSVTLPPGAAGKLVIEYWPAGLTLGLYTALAGILILVVCAVVPLFSPNRLGSRD